jgi:hypothetical protein
MSEEPSSASGRGEIRGVPVQFIIPPELRLTYADIVQVQATKNDGRLLFYQGITPPVGSPQKLAEIKSVNAVCVAQIVLSPRVIAKLSEILQSVLREHAELQKDAAPE